MAEKNTLPSRAALQELIDRLTPSNEQMDETSASIILERAGVDLSTLADDLKERLRSALEEMQASGREPSPVLVEMVTLLEQETEPGEAEEPDPDEWIAGLLAGKLSGAAMGAPQQAPAFRSLKMELLTEEDLKILEGLAAEVQAHKRKEE